MYKYIDVVKAFKSNNADYEEKKAKENKPSTEENTSKALPIKLQTPKSSQRIRQFSKKQNEMSPFSKLYEKLKHEIKVKKPLQEGNVSQQATKEDGKTVLLEPSARISSSGCAYDLGSLPKEKESPRGKNRQSAELSNKSVHSQTLASQESPSELASPAGQKSGSGGKRGRPRTSGLLTEKAVETSAVQEHQEKTADRKDSGAKEELATKGCPQKQDLEDASVKRPGRLSSKRRSSGSTSVRKDNEAVSEINISGLFAEEESGKTKTRTKRSGNLLPQPVGKRKRVSFGGHLSPELFDKSLPPNSPLKRGAIPARLSLPFGNSPRAVLKKAQGLKHFAVQKEKMSPKNLPSQKSPAASSPASGKATPKLALGSPAPDKKGRFSISLVTTPLPIAEENDAVAEDMKRKKREKNGARVETPKSSQVNQAGHAESPATIVVGRAYSTRVGMAGQVPKVVKNPTMKLNMKMDESFTGMTEMLKTPENKSGRTSPMDSDQQTDFTPMCTAAEISELHTPEESEKQASWVTLASRRKTPKQKPEPVEDLSGIRQLMKTPKQKPEPVDDLSGIKQLVKTPKQKPEPVEDLSGIKQLMKTPKQKPEPVEDLSGIKQLMKTPKQKLEPVEDLSGIKELFRTPKQKQKPEPAEDLSGIRQLMKTPKQKHQPVEDMIGVSRIFKTPHQKVEPLEDMYGVSRLVKTPREKYQPVDDFVGLQRLMAEPRQKCSDYEVDYVGVAEMFDIPEEIKVGSVNVMDSEQEDAAPPCTNSSHKHEDKGNISQREDSQQKESTSEHQSTQRPTRGRSRKTVHTASAKECEKNLDLKDLQGLEENNTQEEMGEISTSASVPENKGRGRRTNRCIREEIASECPDQEKVETLSFVEPHGAMKQALQEYGTSDDPTRKTASVSSSIQNENYQLEAGLKEPENKPNAGGVKDNEEKLLLTGKRSKGVKTVEDPEALIPPKRARRARNDQVKQASSEDHRGTTVKLHKYSSAKKIQKDEQAFDKDSETTTAEESESRTKLEIKVTEKRVKSLRSARKPSAEVKSDVCGMALQNTENIHKTKETSSATDTQTQPRIKNEIKISQGDETEDAQENTTEASQRLKAESPSGETNKMPVTALNLEANKSAVQETNRPRNRRGKKDSLEKKTEFPEVVNNIEPITPKFKAETEMVKSSPKDSLGSVCVENTYQVPKDHNNPAGTSVPAANSDSLAPSRQKRTRNAQGILKPKQAEMLQENQAQNNGTAWRRGRGRKVNFKLEEAVSKVMGGKRSLPGDDEGVTYKHSQHETSENPSSQVRRSRRKQADSIPQTACSTYLGKQTLIADHTKDEAVVKEQDSAVEATPSSTEDNPLRRGRRQEVATASQTSRSLSIRKRRGLLEGDDKKMTEREEQNPALQANANASARYKRKKIDLTAEAKSSSSLQRKCGLSETDDKMESTNEEQNTPLETVSCAKEKPRMMNMDRYKKGKETKLKKDFAKTFFIQDWFWEKAESFIAKPGTLRAQFQVWFIGAKADYQFFRGGNGSDAAISGSRKQQPMDTRDSAQQQRLFHARMLLQIPAGEGTGGFPLPAERERLWSAQCALKNAPRSPSVVWSGQPGESKTAPVDSSRSQLFASGRKANVENFSPTGI
nr:PREDICTED: antigen KI-67-like [Opisthocomus hoazin]